MFAHAGSWHTKNNFIHPRLSIQGIHFSVFCAIMTLQVCFFHYSQRVPTHQTHGLASHFYKEEVISPFVLERPTLRIHFSFFLAVLAVFHFRYRLSPLIVVTCQSLMTQRDDAQ